MESIQHHFWCTGELALRTLGFLSLTDVLHCAQVSRSFNRFAVQSVLDSNEIWNPEKNAILTLAPYTYFLDALSALLLSVHIKRLGRVVFKLDRVTSLRTAIRSFDKMQRLVEKVESVHTVEIQWPSRHYGSHISENDMASACRAVKEFLDTVIARGCTSLDFAGFAVFSSNYSWEAKEAEVVAPDLFSEEKYYRRRSRSDSLLPWESLAPPSPSLREASKLTKLSASNTVLRPPFSEWLFSLLKASPVTFLAIWFEDAPDHRAERKFILDRLAAVAPNATTINLESGARAYMMKNVVAWLGRFELLERLKIEPECLSVAGNSFSATNDDDLESLRALARLPNIRSIISSSSFMCAYLAARRGVDRGPLAKNLNTLTMRHVWKWSSREAISECLEDVEQLCNAVTDACSEEERANLCVRINFCFDCSWFDIAEELGRMWDRVDQAKLRKIHPVDGSGSKAGTLEEVESAPSYFRPATEPTRLGLWLELHTTVSEHEIQRGVVDDEIMAFCRMLPTLRCLLLCSPFPSLTPRKSSPLRKERVDIFRSVCPELENGSVY